MPPVVWFRFRAHLSESLCPHVSVVSFFLPVAPALVRLLPVVIGFDCSLLRVLSACSGAQCALCLAPLSPVCPFTRCVRRVPVSSLLACPHLLGARGAPSHNSVCPCARVARCSPSSTISPLHVAADPFVSALVARYTLCVVAYCGFSVLRVASALVAHCLRKADDGARAGHMAAPVACSQ